jgi:heme exporter protein B
MPLVWAVISRELRAEWRRRETLTTIVLFSLLTLVTFVFSFDPARHPREVVLPGALWTAIFFAGMLGLNRAAARDAADGGLIGVVLSPADRGLLYLGKLCAQFVFLVLAETILLLFAILWFDLDGRHLRLPLFALLLLGSLGFLSVGTVFAVIGQKTRLREVMLPVLLLPVLSPLILGLAEATAIVLAGGERGLRPWFSLVGAFDLLFLTAGFLLYGFVLEE